MKLQESNVFTGVLPWGWEGISCPILSRGSVSLMCSGLVFPKVGGYVRGWVCTHSQYNRTQSASGLYITYWNAFLFGIIFAKNCMEMEKIGLRSGAPLIRVLVHFTLDIWPIIGWACVCLHRRVIVWLFLFDIHSTCSICTCTNIKGTGLSQLGHICMSFDMRVDG